MKQRSAIVRAGTLVLALLLVVIFCQQEAIAVNQPNMEATLKSLRKARVQLKRALPNKGGHRLKGIALIDDAIDEVHKGIVFANQVHKWKKLKNKKKKK